MTHSEAAAYIASMLESIQVLHAQARAVADEHNIPFNLTLDNGCNYDSHAEYAPTSAWANSSYNC